VSQVFFAVRDEPGGKKKKGDRKQEGKEGGKKRERNMPVILSLSKEGTRHRPLKEAKGKKGGNCASIIAENLKKKGRGKKRGGGKGSLVLSARLPKGGRGKGGRSPEEEKKKGKHPGVGPSSGIKKKKILKGGREKREEEGNAPILPNIRIKGGIEGRK